LIIERVPPDDDLVGARLDDPPVLVVVVGEVGGRDGEVDGAGLARRQLKLAERLELLGRSLDAGAAGADVELDDLL
jgi:hypothetical protein